MHGHITVNGECVKTILDIAPDEDEGHYDLKNDRHHHYSLIVMTTPIFLSVFKSNHLVVETVPADGHGLDVEELERRLVAGAFSRPPRLVYVIPTHHNPTGTTLPSQRREQLCRLAREHNFVIVVSGSIKICICVIICASLINVERV